MTDPKENEKEEKEKAIREVFETIDVDENGSLSLKEVVLFLKGVMDDISEENMRTIFYNLDNNEDQIIDFEEFKVSSLARYIEYIYAGQYNVMCYCH